MKGHDFDIERRTAYLAGIACDAGSPQAREAFAQLVRLWHPVWLRFARSRGPDVAEDALQEAVLTMAKNIHRLREPERFKAWSMTIVQRRCADAVRRAIRRREAEGAVEPAPPPAEPDAAIYLDAALARLPAPDRTLIRLHYGEGHTMRALGERFGVPPGTIKSRLHTARRKLKDHLKGDEDEHD